MVVQIFRRSRDARGAVLGLDYELVRLLAAMPYHRRIRLARCPFALFDLRFTDSGFWASVRPRHVPGKYRKTRGMGGPGDICEFAYLVLFFSWHLVLHDRLIARLTLGLPSATCESVGALHLSVLREVVRQGPGLLTTQLCDNRVFWPDLIRCVGGGTPEQAAAAKLLGLQLLAARP